MAIITPSTGPFAGGNYSNVIDRLMLEGAGELPE
jgi:hypothetical protein